MKHIHGLREFPFLRSLVLVVCLSLPAVAHAAKVRDIFPELAARKETIGAVAVLVDATVVREEGGTPVVRRARARAYGDSMLALAREALERKGLRVAEVRLLSMGINYREELGFRIAEDDSTPASQLVNPPFYLDSLLTQSAELVAGWKSVNRTLSGYTRRKKDAAVALVPGSDLAKALNADAIAIVRVASWDVPLGKQWGSIFDPSQDTVRKSSSFVGLTIISGSDGMVVWDDWISNAASLKPDQIRDRMGALEKNLP